MKQNITANGETNVAKLANPSFNVTGDFDGGTLKLQFRELGATEWSDIPDAAFTDEFGTQIQASREIKVRGVLTGATAPDIDLIIF